MIVIFTAESAPQLPYGVPGAAPPQSQPPRLPNLVALLSAADEQLKGLLDMLHIQQANQVGKASFIYKYGFRVYRVQGFLQVN